MKKNIVVLVSGDGSNLQSIINNCQNGNIDGQISAVISNNPNAYALQRAKEAMIPTHVIEPASYRDNAHYDNALIECIEHYQPKLIALAGFMRVLTPAFVQKYSGRLLNIHPSLLPKYPGLNTHAKVIENQEEEHGSSIHFVTEKIDSGPVVLQSKIAVFRDDTEESLMERIKRMEHQIYPIAIHWFMQDRLKLVEQHAWLDGNCLTSQSYPCIDSRNQ